jgi:hypothetical protein
MYVGYNTSGDEEGFIIWLFASDRANVQILSPVEEYSATGDMGHIVYSKENSDADVVVVDESHITMSFRNDEYEDEKGTSEYQFTKGDIDDSLLEQFGGKWVGGMNGTGYRPACEITYDDGYHYTITYDDGTVEKCNHEKTTDAYGETRMPDIFLYNGTDKMFFLTPYGEVDDENGFCFSSQEFCIGENKLFYNFCETNADGAEYTLYKEGSEEAQVQDALCAYQSYITENDIEFDGCELIYLDDDNIPELVYLNVTWETLLTYSDNQVQATEAGWGMSGLSYREKTGEFVFAGINGSYAHQDFYKYENGSVTHLGMAQHVCYDGEDGKVNEYYIGDDEEVSEEKYEEYWNSFGEYDKYTECSYTFLYDAYQNLSGGVN